MLQYKKNFIYKKWSLSCETGYATSQNLTKNKNIGRTACLQHGTPAHISKRCEITFFDEGGGGASGQSGARETKRYKFKYYFSVKFIFHKNININNRRSIKLKKIRE